MACVACANRPVFERLCKEHFLGSFERRVRDTIAKHRLLTKREKVLVAASGGKDSLTTLFLLKKLGYDVSALAIDEGIAGYRPETLRTLRRFCGERGIPLRVVTFKEAYGEELDAMLRDGKKHPCTVCGTFRRQLLNRHAQGSQKASLSGAPETRSVSRGFDAIATGHNADDEAQAVLMNLCRANSELFPRGGPVTTSDAKGFVKRVKPLYFCTEKEVLTYALLNGYAGAWNECPYVVRAYRAEVRDALNRYEATRPGAKRRVLARYLAVKRNLAAPQHPSVPCATCGEPSADGACKACRLLSPAKQ